MFSRYFFTTPVKIKSVLQRYCFQAVGNDRDEEVFYGDFMRVFFMENWVVTNIKQGLILTLCPDLMRPLGGQKVKMCFID